MAFVRHIVFLLLGLYVEGKTLVGLLDQIVATSDWSDIGQFTFNIPKGLTGFVEFDVVVSGEGHTLLLLTQKTKQSVLRHSGLNRLKFPAFSWFHSHRQLNAAKIKQLSLANTTQSSDTETTLSNMTFSNTISEMKGNSSYLASKKFDFGVVHKERSDIMSPVQEARSIDQHSNTEPGPMYTTTTGLSSRIPTPMNMLIPNDIIRISPEHNAKLITASTVCQTLVESAQVSERLGLHGPDLIHHTVLTVGSSISLKKLSVIITRCDAIPNIKYRIVFTNHGNWLKRHFSYEDQGLLEVFLISFVVALLASYSKNGKTAQLILLKDENPVIGAVLVSTISLLTHIVLELLHLLTYSINGIGIPVFSFLGSLAKLCFTITTAASLSSLILHRRYHRVNSDVCQESIFVNDKEFTESICFPFNMSSFLIFQRLRSWMEAYGLHFDAIHTSLFSMTFSLLLIILSCSLFRDSTSTPLVPDYSLPLFEWWNISYLPLLILLFGYLASSFKISYLVFCVTLNYIRQEYCWYEPFFDPLLRFHFCGLIWFIATPVIYLFIPAFPLVRHIHFILQLTMDEMIVFALWEFLFHEHNLTSEKQKMEQLQLVVQIDRKNNDTIAPDYTHHSVLYAV